MWFRKDSKNYNEMGFLDHLEELRWRIIRALIGIVIGAILCWIFIDFIINEIMVRPAVNNQLRLQNIRPFGQVFLYMQVALIGGIIISLPNILYQFWKFIAPGLYAKERKYIFWIVFFTSFCFLFGVAFAYFVMMPMALKFFAGFGTQSIENIIAINEYISFLVSVILGAGVVFELPMASWFLSKLGILSPEFMRKYRRHAIVVIFILAAILTPGTDPVSQILLAIPLLFLYEISIWICKVAQRKEKRKNVTRT
jgi:sec-independent protein translocase protein TatC